MRPPARCAGYLGAPLATHHHCVAGGGRGDRKARVWVLPAGTCTCAEERWSTLAATSIAATVACRSKSMSVIAFIARSTREYRGFKAGMRRAVCRDAGCVQMCVCG